MEINGERLLSDLNHLKTFTDTPGEGVTRFSYGEQDKNARDYITAAAERQGFAVRTDPAGNLYVRLPERIAPTERICVGSHIDTVRNGGWLDGIYGVVSGLEVLRTLSENGSTRAADVELVIFAEEEGSNFGSTMTGSKLITGIYREHDLDRLKNDVGSSLREILQSAGFPPYREENVIWDFAKVKAMLELHIEQGPVLEQEGKSIGIVDAVYGMTVMEVTLSGIGNHAGATPMRYRKDALTAAALCISEIERIAGRDSEGILVATVGKAAVFPNCSNVIPEKVIFTVEVRDKEQIIIDSTIREIEALIREISSQRGITCEIRRAADSKPFRLDSGIITLLDKLAEALGFEHKILDSGAVHDTCMIAPHAPSGIIFVPSKGGRSHVPFEDTEPDDLVKGARLLLEAVMHLADCPDRADQIGDEN